VFLSMLSGTLVGYLLLLVLAMTYWRWLGWL
jgi:hypothetical protein